MIAETIDAGRVAEQHPLALVVLRRDLINLITWTFTGIVPDRLRTLGTSSRGRRGPVADRPTLARDEQDRFFDQLMVAARTDGPLLRRQAVCLLGFDGRADTRRWLLGEQQSALRAMDRVESVESWMSVRSSAVALARNGDPGALEQFVDTALAEERQEIANLDYWSYWIGEIEDSQTDDQFMTRSDERWVGDVLFGHLLGRVGADAPHLVLDAHTIWALMIARPRMLDGRPGDRASAARRLDELLGVADLPNRTRQELASVSRAVTLAGR